MSYKNIFFFCLMYSSASLAMGPLKITAQKGLACDLTAHTCTASGDVVTTGTNSILKSDSLEAIFHGPPGKTATSTTEPSQRLGHSLRLLTAVGHVRFQTLKGGLSAKGHQATFDSNTQELRLSGKASITHDTATLFAGKSLVFYKDNTSARAVGRSTLRYDNKLLQADTIRLYFERSPDQKLGFKRLEAEGNLVLSTATEIVTAKRGIYRSKTKIVELFDDVIITKKEGQLHGQYVRYDLISGQSEIKSLLRSKGRKDHLTNRVHMVLEPQSVRQETDKISPTT